MKLIAVHPKNYRSIALKAIEIAKVPRVFLDKEEVFDFSDRGPLTQAGIRRCIDFVIKDGKTKIVGFHDHPDEMWVTQPFREFAAFCESQGWLAIQFGS